MTDNIVLKTLISKNLVIGLFLWGIGFTYGVAVYKWKLFPYHPLRDYYLVHLKPAPEPQPWRTDFFEDTTGRQSVDCPSENALLFLSMGQAGSANYISSFGERNEQRSAYQFYNGECYLIEDPMLGATGVQGSLWSSLAQDISQSTGRDVVFITTGAGGSSLTDWIRDDSFYFQRTKHQIDLAKQLGYQVKLAFWYNGAREAELGTTANEYVERFNKLIEKFDFLLNDNASNQWVVFQTSKCWSDGSARVLRGQELAAETNERVFLGPNTDAYHDRNRYDGCHLNHNAKVRINDRLKEIIGPILSDSKEQQ